RGGEGRVFTAAAYWGSGRGWAKGKIAARHAARIVRLGTVVVGAGGGGPRAAGAAGFPPPGLRGAPPVGERGGGPSRGAGPRVADLPSGWRGLPRLWRRAQGPVARRDPVTADLPSGFLGLENWGRWGALCERSAMPDPWAAFTAALCACVPNRARRRICKSIR